MIGDFLHWVSEGLFFLMFGVPLANTAVMFIYVGTIALAISYMIIVAVTKLRLTPKNSPRRIRAQAFVVFTAMSIPVLLLLAVGVPLAQVMMLEECRVTVEETVILEQTRMVQVRECRVKMDMNHYRDWGPWKVREIGQPYG